MLGVDPSTVATGWGVVAARGDEIAVVASGVIRPSKGAPLETRVSEIFGAVNAILDDGYGITSVAIEDQFMGKNARSLKALCYVTGVVMLAAVEHGLPVRLYEPKVARRLVAGYGNASKVQVQQMIKVLTGIPVVSLDESDALAIAIAHLGEGCRR